jgi:hypothetical protein
MGYGGPDAAAASRDAPMLVIPWVQLSQLLLLLLALHIDC